ncbi:MAG: 4Fe-4S binding protein [Erysipelotrichaceae bacterium]
MIRQMIQIDKELCNGCGLCVTNCAEGAIGLIDKKAHVLREDYCDGLGACLPACPVGALTLKMLDVPAFTDPHQEAQDNPDAKNWPLQIQLSPLTSNAYANAHLLIAADCTAFASPRHYTTLSDGKAVLIGCPKFDKFNLVGRLASILKANEINEVSILRMDVPCCRALETAVREAVLTSQKDLKISIHIIQKDGRTA